MTLPGASKITSDAAFPALWLAIYAVRLTLYLIAGGLLARRPAPLGWRFWIAAPGFLAAALEAGLAAAIDTRARPRGRWFIPFLSLFLAASSAGLALLALRLVEPHRG